MVFFLTHFGLTVINLDIKRRLMRYHQALYPLYVICMVSFVSDLRQVGGFLCETPVSSTNKTDHHDITEILLKVTLNTINPNTKLLYCTKSGFKHHNHNPIICTC